MGFGFVLDLFLINEAHNLSFGEQNNTTNTIWTKKKKNCSTCFIKEANKLKKADINPLKNTSQCKNSMKY